MELKEKIIVLLFVIIAFSIPEVYAQKATRQSASEAFAKGNFEQAFSDYSELLRMYPRDPVYKYYSAACLVKLERNPEEAATLMEQALSSGSLKSLPDDAVFYLARTRQMQGNFDEAEKTFNRFTADAGKKKAKELGVPEYIKQCREGKGRIDAVVSVAEVKPPETKTEYRPSPPVPQSLPEEVDKNLGQKLEAQYRADSMEAAQLKAKQSVTSEVKPTLPDPAPVENAAPEETVQASPVAVTSAPAAHTAVIEPQASVANITDTTIRLREMLSKTPAVLSVFEVLPQPVTDPKATIEINPEPPEGLIYRIQTAVFRNPVQLAYFKGISPIYGIKGPGATVTTYYAGIFRKAADAAKALASVKAKGFKDSFVVGQMANKTVSAERAAIMEKEWGDKPLFGAVLNKTSEKLDTIPPTLLLKVEVTKSIQPLREEAIEPMRRLAGKRNFDMVTLENGSTAYLIGNFITFESAEDFAGLLQRNGYRDAKVVAWLGKREIDIQTAKQLFETLK
ncbi:MAG TPA: hypothetical protein VK207_10765 [Bacteroidales bacterium]|nr:hypothetical protein [Bacteroidales bacterium]